ncbi:MAG TPA: TIGR03545 family protein, partial [Bdellovibrionales bacterium]|nr:TIGR03545 family protein [Bdellovibrionales bacterium]
EKKKKKKGPIRIEAILPAVLILGLVYGYFYFFFDGHLRRAAEYALTQIHGAEVNIGNIETSVFNASLLVQKIQITDKNQPERDLFRVGEIHFKALWDGLLRAKVVIDDASIKNIQALVPRERPGRVLPPPPPDGKPGIIAKAEKEIVDQTRAKLQDNFIGDIAAVAGGVDVKDQLGQIESNLKASVRIKELEEELNKKK